MRNINQLPGWRTKIEEVSNGVYFVSLMDTSGRRAEVTDADLDAAMLKAQEFAFSIEKEISVDWNRFLFDLCVINLDGLPIVKKYEDAHCGSWIVELGDRRIIYDAKEKWLISQLKNNNKWSDILFSRDDNLTFEICWSMIRAIAIKDETHC